MAELQVLVAVSAKIEEDGEYSERITRSLPLGEVKLPGELTFEEADIVGSSGMAKSRRVDSFLGSA
jgi:hypothetical protein